MDSVPFTNPIVAGNTLIRQAIQSENFSIGSDNAVAGWQIARDGSATFTSVTIGSANYNIDTDGNAAFEDVTVNDDILLGGISLTDFIEGQPGGLISYGDSQSANVTGAAWTVDSGAVGGAAKVVAEFSFGPVDPTHIYKITTSWNYSVTATGTVYRHTLRYTIDGTTPGTSSLIIDGSDFELAPAVATQRERVDRTLFYYSSAAYDVVRIAITLIRDRGTVNTMVLDLDNANTKLIVAVEDMGLKDTAVSGGSLSQKFKSTGTDDPDPTKRYTKTYSCNWSRSWDQDGGRVHSTNGEMVQGTYPDGNGGRRAWYGFPFSTIQSDLTSATVNKVEVYLYYDHWYYNSGGTASIGYHNSTATSAPSYDGTKDAIDEVQSANWGVNVGRWVDITSGGAFTASGWKTGVHTGITISGNGSSNLIYYGKARGNTDSHEAQLRITYTK